MLQTCIVKIINESALLLKRHARSNVCSPLLSTMTEKLDKAYRNFLFAREQLQRTEKRFKQLKANMDPVDVYIWHCQNKDENLKHINVPPQYARLQRRLIHAGLPAIKTILMSWGGPATEFHSVNNPCSCLTECWPAETPGCHAKHKKAHTCTHCLGKD